jgi:succinyl-CoA synthetase alpha subunit
VNRNSVQMVLIGKISGKKEEEGKKIYKKV